MLADGIYRVQFETLVGSGTGIVVVSRDKIRGGDPAFAYFGTLQRTDNGFVADIETKRHAPGRYSVYETGGEKRVDAVVVVTTTPEAGDALRSLAGKLPVPRIATRVLVPRRPGASARSTR